MAEISPRELELWLQQHERPRLVQALRNREHCSMEQAHAAFLGAIRRKEVADARARASAAQVMLDGAHELYMDAPRSPLDGAFEKVYAAVRELVEAIELLTRGER